MKPEIPAQGILKQNDYGHSIWYLVPCDCSDPTHGHQIDVESDETGVTVYIYSKVITPWYSKNRFRQIWDILTKGYAEMETVTILKQQQAVNYAHILLQAAQDVAKIRQAK